MRALHEDQVLFRDRKSRIRAGLFDSRHRHRPVLHIATQAQSVRGKDPADDVEGGRNQREHHASPPQPPFRFPHSSDLRHCQGVDFRVECHADPQHRAARVEHGRGVLRGSPNVARGGAHQRYHEHADLGQIRPRTHHRHKAIREARREGPGHERQQGDIVADVHVRERERILRKHGKECGCDHEAKPHLSLRRLDVVHHVAHAGRPVRVPRREALALHVQHA
mmetsp:Transcript_19657/g.58821  ORF Transcript_19657/g.58821 Transcript_19657/m.58821 type:complete len:223 (-) Transcript_19657:222-890(-)